MNDIEDNFMGDFMETKVNFDDFMKDFDDSFDNEATKPRYNKTKNNRAFVPCGDSKALLDNLDKYMPDNPGTAQNKDIASNSYPYNVWEFLSSEGFDRCVIKHISIEFDCVNNIVEKLTIETIEGHGAIFANIQLQDK